MTVPESATARRRAGAQTSTIQAGVAGVLRPPRYPFLTGPLGLTRYAADGDNEIRFTASAGVAEIDARAAFRAAPDGRLFATFVEVEGRAIACSPGICSVAFNANIVWQAEFTAALVVGF